MKSVHDKALRDKACHHHNKTLLGKAMLAWKGYIHLCFRIKVSELLAAFGDGLEHPRANLLPNPWSDRVINKTLTLHMCDNVIERHFSIKLDQSNVMVYTLFLPCFFPTNQSLKNGFLFFGLFSQNFLFWFPGSDLTIPFDFQPKFGNHIGFTMLLLLLFFFYFLLNNWLH